MHTNFCYRFITKLFSKFAFVPKNSSPSPKGMLKKAPLECWNYRWKRENGYCNLKWGHQLFIQQTVHLKENIALFLSGVSQNKRKTIIFIVSCYFWTPLFEGGGYSTLQGSSLLSRGWYLLSITQSSHLGVLIFSKCFHFSFFFVKSCQMHKVFCKKKYPKPLKKSKSY